MNTAQPKFFSSGNARLIGRAVHDQNWQEVLGLIDQFVLTWPGSALASRDVIFEWQESGLYLYREMTGFVTARDLRENGFESRDVNQSLAAQWQAPYSWDTDLGTVKDWAENLKKEIQHTDFPEEYGELTAWQVRLGVNFSDLNQVQASWNFYAVFARASSSIFTF